MTEIESESLVKGDVLFLQNLFESGIFKELATAEIVSSRANKGDKVMFLHHHHHLPEFLIAENDGQIGIYHRDEVTRRKLNGR
jgi:hypothetical protein